jgi:DNA-binding IclR family transcriptional regulator
MTVEAVEPLKRVYQAVAQSDPADPATAVTAAQVAEATGLPLTTVTACLEELAARSVLRLERTDRPAQTRALPYR